MPKAETKTPKSLDELKPAPYNPRTIANEALEGLGKSVDAYGDLSGIVWNARSGVLVAGHQRLKALKRTFGDSLEFDAARCVVVTPSGEFKIRVVDWDAKKERQANLAANARSIQGDWEFDKLGELMSDMAQMGADMDMAFIGQDYYVEQVEHATPEDVSEKSPKLKAFIDKRKEAMIRSKDRGEVNFYLCLVFASYAQKMEFIEAAGLETKYGLYMDGEAFSEKLNIPITPNTQKAHEPKLEKQLVALVMESEHERVAANGTQ